MCADMCGHGRVPSVGMHMCMRMCGDARMRRMHMRMRRMRARMMRACAACSCRMLMSRAHNDERGVCERAHVSVYAPVYIRACVSLMMRPDVLSRAAADNAATRGYAFAQRRQRRRRRRRRRRRTRMCAGMCAVMCADMCGCVGAWAGALGLYAYVHAHVRGCSYAYAYAYVDAVDARAGMMRTRIACAACS